MSTIGRQLARVEHIRCGEFSAYTYVWVPADMTEAQFAKHVYAAEREYLAALKEFAGSEKPSSAWPYSINWETHRDKNVGDVLDEHNEKLAQRKEREAKRREALKTFGQFLVKQEGIESFWDVKPDINGEIDWGHQHGTKIDYGNTEWPEFRLLKPAKTARAGAPVRVIEETEEWL